VRKERAHVDHISTDDLERYGGGEITDVLLVARIEEHLAGCQECADRMLAVEKFLTLVRAGFIVTKFGKPVA
jgi:hypothetical protein